MRRKLAPTEEFVPLLKHLGSGIENVNLYDLGTACREGIPKNIKTSSFLMRFSFLI
jgi:hypothetical protein